MVRDTFVLKATIANKDEVMPLCDDIKKFGDLVGASVEFVVLDNRCTVRYTGHWDDAVILHDTLSTLPSIEELFFTLVTPETTPPP